MFTEKNTLRETVLRENSLIPFYVYKQIWTDYNLYLHWHDEIEIIYVEKGSLIFNVNTNPILVNEGDVLIINSGALHSATASNDIPSIHYAMLFDLRLLYDNLGEYYENNIIKPLLNGSLLFPLLLDKNFSPREGIIKEIKNAVSYYDNKEKAWELDVKISLSKILSLLIKNDALTFKYGIDSSKLNNKIEVIKKSLNYIKENYKEKIYIENLAKEVNMNPQYFCRFFKTNIGKTPIEYVNEYRINKACKLLETTDKKVLDICFEVGFENLSHFIKKFKEYKFITPNQYKKNSNIIRK